MEGAVGRTTHGSTSALEAGAPAKMPMKLDDTLWWVDMPTSIEDSVAEMVGCGEKVLVTARPTPVPENSTLTVVAEAASAGPSLGTNRAGRTVSRLFPRVALRVGGPRSLWDISTLPVGEKSLDMGAIHAATPPCNPASRSFSNRSASALPGFKASSLIRKASEGSRTISFTVTRSWPNSVNASLKT